MVEKQICTLIPNLSFGHTSMFQVPKWVMWAHFKHLSFKSFSMVYWSFRSNEFWPLQLPFENLWIHQDSNSQNGSSLGNVEVHSFTFSYIFGNMKCDFRASFLVHIFVSPYFGCKLKAKVVTMCELMYINVPKTFHMTLHMNYHVKIMHINWNYD